MAQRKFANKTSCKKDNPLWGEKTIIVSGVRYRLYHTISTPDKNEPHERAKFARKRAVEEGRKIIVRFAKGATLGVPYYAAHFYEPYDKPSVRARALRAKMKGKGY